MDGLTPLDDLAVFVRVAELGNFASASRSLSMPRSTVSRRIATLEERIGCRLLERTTRHVRLTEAGRRLCEGASSHLRSLSHLLEEVVNDDDVPEGRVRAATPVGLGRSFGVAFLRRLHEKLPGIHGEIIATDRRVDLVRDDLDLALVEGPLTESSCIARKILTTDAFCVASPSYLAIRGTPSRPADLETHATLHRSVDGERLTRWPLKGGGYQTVRPMISTTDVDMLCSAAVEGLGIAFLSRAVVYSAVSKGDLVPILPAVSEKRSYHLLFQERNPPRRVRAVMDFALEFIVELHGGF